MKVLCLVNASSLQVYLLELNHAIYKLNRSRCICTWNCSLLWCTHMFNDCLDILDLDV